MDRAEAIGVLTIEQASHRKDGLVDRAIDMAIAALREQEQSKWISVKERLPVGCGMACLLVGVNCFGQRDVFEGFTGYMEKGKFEWHTNLKDKDMAVWTITHWMPLPEPPAVQPSGVSPSGNVNRKEGAEG